MIIRDKTNDRIEKIKQRFSLIGDVYLIGGIIESLQSHKNVVKDSYAKTIEEAEEERRNILNSK